jgi:hemerythrin-like domain-containing protein
MELFPADHEALTLLKKDHDDTKTLLAAFEAAPDVAGRRAAALKALEALKVHCIVEEEMLYPALRIQPDDHQGVAVQICELERLDPAEAAYAEKFATLAESVRRHIDHEERSVFPKALTVGLDLRVLGARMAARRSELSWSAQPSA